jgi:hypothetical protein
MICDRVQRAISARMDAEPPDPRAPLDVERHLATCERCRAFAASAERVRAAVRIGPADPVPDLVSSIIGDLERELQTVSPTPPHAPAPRRPADGAGPRWQRAMPVAAALLAGAIVGSVLVGGPFPANDGDAISANAVVLGVRAAAPALESFDGTFSVVERGFSSEVPVRRLDVRMAFLAPQRFRLDVVDRTIYPEDMASAVSSDLTYIQNGAVTFRQGPSGCPAGLDDGACPPTTTSLTSGATPTDLMVPVATLGSARGVDVIGTDRVEGAGVVRLRLTFARAKAMFPFLWIDELAGAGAGSGASASTWRPFFSGDRVDVQLDAEGWVPRRITVYPASSDRRRAWELRFGLPVEAATVPILDVFATGVGTGAPDPSLFEIPDAPAQPLTIGELAELVGHRPATPTFTGELRLESSVAPTTATETASEASFDSILVYADGLGYLRIGERAGPHAGLVEPVATPITLAGGGVGYYAEATATRGRRITIVADDTTLVLESNLPLPQLLEIAASIPVQGRPLP